MTFAEIADQLVRQREQYDRLAEFLQVTVVDRLDSVTEVAKMLDECAEAFDVELRINKFGPWAYTRQQHGRTLKLTVSRRPFWGVTKFRRNEFPNRLMAKQVNEFLQKISLRFNVVKLLDEEELEKSEFAKKD